MEIEKKTIVQLRKKREENKSKIHDNENKNDSTDDSLSDLPLIKSISLLINDIFNDNVKCSEVVNEKKSVFTAKKPPSIGVFSYLERIQKYSKLEDSTLIVALIYIDRLCYFNEFKLNVSNIHR